MAGKRNVVTSIKYPSEDYLLRESGTSNSDEEESASTAVAPKRKSHPCKCKSACIRCKCVQCSGFCSCKPELCSKRPGTASISNPESQSDRSSRNWRAAGLLLNCDQSQLSKMLSKSQTVEEVVTKLQELKLEDEPIEVEPSFCICTKLPFFDFLCTVMPTGLENVCCEVTPCVTMDVAFHRVCLDKDVLHTEIQFRNDMWRSVDQNNKTYRHYAYRQYIYWKHGWLGKGNRIVCPSCVVKKIRFTFPSPDNVYTGFRPTVD